MKGAIPACAILAAALLATATADASLPPPRFGQSVDIGLVSGTVIVTTPGGHSFRLGTQDRNIPVGSLIDTTHGRVDLRAAPPSPAGNANAATVQVQDAQFFDGAFRVAQSPSNPVAQIRLAGGRFAACAAPAGDHAQDAKLSHKVLRLLWASGSGKFRTVGRYSAATGSSGSE